jgi:non-homologous end joining protein Ku
LESLIASKKAVPSRGREEVSPSPTGNVIGIMDALRKSLEKVSAQKSARKPAALVAPLAKRKRRT